jgi:hypothetical protein
MPLEREDDRIFYQMIMGASFDSSSELQPTKGNERKVSKCRA